MARRIRPETALRVSGVRKLQAARFKADLAKLPTGTDVYDFSRQRGYLRSQIEALEGAEDVRLQLAELAVELLEVAGAKSNFDQAAHRLWVIVGDELLPDEEAFVPITRQ